MTNNDAASSSAPLQHDSAKANATTSNLPTPIPTTSQRVTIPKPSGEILGGILDLPSQSVQGYILMVHCFTCSKDLKAGFRIARGLAGLGWGVLRFDFTGIGHSEGDFSKTNFHTNQEDLLAAAGYLERNYAGPTMLFGHSFGGATAMSVANKIDSVRSVAILATPSDTGHLADILVNMDPRIESEGFGEVTIGGRKFSIDRQMTDNFRTYDLSRDIAALQKPLMIFHSPADLTVGYHHAMRIYSLLMQSNKSPAVEASLVTLPQSDHLLTNDLRDVAMLVQWLDAWAKRLR
ncbi:MAG: alpha/beta hydrolase [Planctomycetota bacterium]|nr:alpha/beta hydrolase [Planctomycetota bacterium]